MRAEVDDYVDTKLANFEVVLDKTLAAVNRGRDKLRGRTAHGRPGRRRGPPARAAPVRHRDPCLTAADVARRRFGCRAAGRVAWPTVPTRGPSRRRPDMSMPEESRRATTRLDPRSPLVLDTRELGRRPGRCARSPDLFRHRPIWASTCSASRTGRRLELDLRLESVVEGVLVSGTVTATMSGECVRCLDPVTAPLVVDLQELYAFPGARPGRSPTRTTTRSRCRR